MPLESELSTLPGNALKRSLKNEHFYSGNTLCFVGALATPPGQNSLRTDLPWNSN